jgi:hypothetical protein
MEGWAERAVEGRDIPGERVALQFQSLDNVCVAHRDIVPERLQYLLQQLGILIVDGP